MAFTAVDAKSHLNLLCPVCRTPLGSEIKSLVCEQKHRFDMAKEGYINLLLLKKRPKHLGDTKAMFRARRAFLEAGHYEPLARLVSRTAQELLIPQQPEPAVGRPAPRILDVGCGEGYYLQCLATHLADLGIEHIPLGMDIAKEGVRLAAKHSSQSRFFVADVNQPLLFADCALDLILNLFAPRNPAEFRRILKPNGHLLIVIPDENHLSSLRTHFDLLEIQADKASKLTVQMSRVNFQLIRTEQLSFSMTLSSDDIYHLIEMTPNHHHVTAADVCLPDTIEVRASFRLLVFEK